MQEITAFLEKAKIFYLATAKNNIPFLRPFGAVLEDHHKTYLVTGKKKDVYQQIKENPHIAISALLLDGTVMRINSTLKEDHNFDVKVQMLAKNPILKDIYNANDDNMALFYLSGGYALISGLNSEIKEIKID